MNLLNNTTRKWSAKYSLGKTLQKKRVGFFNKETEKKKKKDIEGESVDWKT